MKLYTYWRSSSAYRVRIALNLKGLEYEPRFVHLRQGQQHQAEYRRLNPQGVVPTLVVAERVLTQSLAIIEYLEEAHPEPPLLPAAQFERARVRALASVIACDIQPLNNQRVLQFLQTDMGHDTGAVNHWYRTWLHRGFAALETLLEPSDTGKFCHGDTPTLADVLLIPQVYNAIRYDCDLSAYPTIGRINATCLALDAFSRAAPENQPDAEG